MFNKLNNIYYSPKFLGPIFETELLFASRRKRTFFIMSLYILLICLPLILFILEFQSNSMSASYVINLSSSSQVIVSGALVFMNFVLPLLTILILSNSIAKDIQKRRISEILSTPITSSQYVLGKLFSRLFQIFILMLIMLPVFTILRTFGGISWSVLWQGLLLNAMNVLFAGSLTLLISSYSQKFFSTVIRVVLLRYIIKSIIFSIGMLFLFVYNQNLIFNQNFRSSSPMLMIIFSSSSIFPFFCVIFGGLWILADAALTIIISGLLLLWTKSRVRKLSSNLTANSNRINRKTKSTRQESITTKIKGSPIIWLECKRNLFFRGKVSTILTYALLYLFCILVLVFLFTKDTYNDPEAYMYIYGIAFFFASFITISTAASSITIEKESGTWISVLLTPYSEKQIFIDKIFAIAKKVLPVWIPFLVFVFVSVYFTSISWLIVPFALLSIFQALLFLISTGLIFSMHLKSSSTATILSASLVAVAWILMLFIGIQSDILPNLFMYATPIAQPILIAISLEHGINTHTALNFIPWTLLALIVNTLIAYLAINTGFNNCRKNYFEEISQ